MSVFIKKIQLLITDTYNVLPKVTYIEFDPTDLKMLDTDFFVCRPLAGYGLPPPQGEFCRPYFLKPNVLRGFCNMLAL